MASFRALVHRRYELLGRKSRLDAETRAVRDELREVLAEVERLTRALFLPVPAVGDDGQLNLLHDPAPAPALIADPATARLADLAATHGFPAVAVRACERAQVRTLGELVRWIATCGGRPWNDEQIPLRLDDARAVARWLEARALLPEGAAFGEGGRPQRPAIVDAARAMQAKNGAVPCANLEALAAMGLDETAARLLAAERLYVGHVCERVARTGDWWKDVKGMTAGLARHVEGWLVRVAGNG